MFKDREDAGKKLAEKLAKYKDGNTLVLAIPRGGVEIGYEVAKYIEADFDLLISRKLPFPDNPESGFGAVAEDGSTFIFDDAYNWLTEDQIKVIEAEQKEEIKRRIEVLRNGLPISEIINRTVILVDDGLAMGSTMRVAISLCRNNKAGKIVVAVPVSGEKVAQEIKTMVDEIVVLEKPIFFQAVAQVYINWHDVSDQEVKEILNRWRRHKQKH